MVEAPSYYRRVNHSGASGQRRGEGQDLASQEHLLTRHQDSQTGFLQALCPQEHALTPLDPLGPAHLGRYSLRDAER